MDHYVLIWAVCLLVEGRVQDENLTDMLALETGFSLAHIRDVFRKRTGCTLTRYIRERRLANAAQELLHTDVDVIDVALRYCFSGRDVFSRAFRRHTGYSPSEFRAVRPVQTRVRLAAGLYGAALPQKRKEDI